MRSARVWLGLILLLVLATACSAQPTQGQATETTLSALDTAAGLLPQINLPRIVIEYDEAGVPSLFGIKAAALQPFVPFNLQVLNMRSDYIAWFQRSNLQHIEIVYNREGMFLYANGKPLPHLAWDEESVKNLGEVATMLNLQNAAVMRRVLPILQRFGVDVVLQFPIPEGAEPIPYREGGVSSTPSAEEVQPSAVIHLAIEYREDGLPTLMGLTSRDLSRLTGADLRFTELPESTIAYLKAVNMQHVQLQTRPDGVRIFVNGMTLPHLAYNEEELSNAVELYKQLFPAQAEFGEFLRQVLMMVQRADVDLAVQFPVRQGAQRIPLHMGN